MSKNLNIAEYKEFDNEIETLLKEYNVGAKINESLAAQKKIIKDIHKDFELHDFFLAKYSNEVDLIKYHIDIFDDWVDNILPKVINASINSNIGVVQIIFDKILPPMTDDKIAKPLLPIFCRNNRLSYEFTVAVNIIYTPNNESIKRKKTKNNIVYSSTDPIIYNNKVLCKMPLMLKSKYCHLSNKSDEELKQMGEDPSDPFTYFIIHGREEIIIMHEKLSEYKILLIDNNIPNITITVPSRKSVV